TCPSRTVISTPQPDTRDRLGVPWAAGFSRLRSCARYLPLHACERSQSVRLPSCRNRNLHVLERASGLPRGRPTSNPYRYRVSMTRYKTVGCRQPASLPASEATHPVSPLCPAGPRTGISLTAAGPTRTAPMVDLTAAFPHLRSIRPPSSSP